MKIVDYFLNLPLKLKISYSAAKLFTTAEISLSILTGSPHAQTPLIALRSHFLIPALLYILKGICYAYCLREFSINSPVLSCLFFSSLKRTPDIRSSLDLPCRHRCALSRFIVFRLCLRLKFPLMLKHYSWFLSFFGGCACRTRTGRSNCVGDSPLSLRLQLSWEGELFLCAYQFPVCFP